MIRGYATSHEQKARSSANTSLNQLAGGARTQAEGWRLLQRGPKLEQTEISLFVALNDEPPVKLVEMLRLLKRHGLRIRIVIVKGKRVRLSSKV